MKTVLLVLMASALLLPVIQAQPGSVLCAEPDEAVRWWKSQEDEGRLARAPRELQEFHAAAFPRLQLGDVPDPPSACAFLDDLLMAVAEDDPRDGVRHLWPASAAAAHLDENLLVRPALTAVKTAAGERLEAMILDTRVTPERIELLLLAHETYTAVGAEGDQVRIELWLALEDDTWRRDLARTQQDVQRAERLARLLENRVSNALFLAQTPRMIEDLRADRVIMLSHEGGDGGSHHVVQIDDAIELLESRRAAGMGLALTSGAATTVIAACCVLLAGLHYRRMEADILDVEVALVGVPP